MTEFPNTTWGMITRLHDPQAQREGLDVLCRRYWRPIHSFVRRALKMPDADAADVTQAFFLWLLEQEVLARYQPQAGRFRAYLKGLLRNFVGNYQSALSRLKRGGGHAHVPLVDALRDLRGVLPDDRELTPEQAFDRAWAQTLVETATQAVILELRTRGRARAVAIYEAYELTSPGEQPTYEDVAARLTTTVATVRRDLFAVREAIREAIRRELRATVGSDGELEDEWQQLLG